MPTADELRAVSLLAASVLDALFEFRSAAERGDGAKLVEWLRKLQHRADALESAMRGAEQFFRAAATTPVAIWSPSDPSTHDAIWQTAAMAVAHVAFVADPDRYAPGVECIPVVPAEARGDLIPWALRNLPTYDELNAAQTLRQQELARAVATADARPQAAERTIPPEDRTVPMTYRRAAKMLGKGDSRDAAEWVSLCVQDGILACEHKSRQTHVFSKRDFPQSVWKDILPKPGK